MSRSFMNNKITSISLVALSSLLLAGCTLPGSSKPQTVSQAANEAQEFARAIESGKPTVCTMSKSGDTMEYFIKGKMMKIDTTSTTTDEKGVATTSVGHMISDTKFLYTWDDKTKSGAKMAIPTEEESKKLADDAKQFQADSKVPSLESEADFDSYKNEGYAVTCKAGSVDDSLFVPPADVKFIDPSDMMKAIPSPDAAGNIDMSKLKDFEKQFGGLDESADGL
jgi:hypothetical protein